MTRTLGIGSSHTLPCYLGEGQLGGESSWGYCWYPPGNLKLSYFKGTFEDEEFLFPLVGYVSLSGGYISCLLWHGTCRKYLARILRAYKKNIRLDTIVDRESVKCIQVKPCSTSYIQQSLVLQVQFANSVEVFLKKFIDFIQETVYSSQGQSALSQTPSSWPLGGPCGLSSFAPSRLNADSITTVPLGSSAGSFLCLEVATVEVSGFGLSQTWGHKLPAGWTERFSCEKKMAPRWIASGELCFKTLKKKM